MSKSRHTEAQTIGALKQVETGGKVSKHTLHAWKAKYGGMGASQAREAKQLRLRRFFVQTQTCHQRAANNVYCSVTSST